MDNALQLADTDQTIDLLVRIGVDPEIAKVSMEASPPKKVELRSIQTKGKGRYGLLVLPVVSQSQMWFYLIREVVDVDNKSTWSAIDSIHPSCWRTNCTYDLTQLGERDVDDIFIHHINLGHGSNYVADRSVLFTVRDGKFAQALATQDYLNQDILGGSSHDLEQISTFLPFPGRLLEETRTSATNGEIKKVERRYWHWARKARKLLPGNFTPVLVPRA